MYRKVLLPSVWYFKTIFGEVTNFVVAELENSPTLISKPVIGSDPESLPSTSYYQIFFLCDPF